MKVKVQPVDTEYPTGRFVGFDKVAEMEWSNEPYEFDITGVWVRQSDGSVWYADDSGCSCPTPWENTTELTRLYNMEPLESRYDKASCADLDAWRAFKARVSRALAELACYPGDTNRDARCSFCHKAAKSVRRLITSVDASICDECIDVASDMITEGEGGKVK